VGHPPDNVSVCPPGIGNATLLSGPPARGLTTHIIGYLGPLKRYKGVPDVVKALPFVRGRFPDASVMIAGRGYLESELRALAADLRLSESVSFEGYIAEAAKRQFYDSCSVMVYPSASEGGWSISVLEAMAMGVVPVVTPTLSEMVADGRGFVVPYASPRSIAKAVTTLWDDPELLGGVSGRAMNWARRFTSDSGAAGVIRTLRDAGLRGTGSLGDA